MAGMIKSSIHHFDGFVGLAGNGGGSGKDGGRAAICSPSLVGLGVDTVETAFGVLPTISVGCCGGTGCAGCGLSPGSGRVTTCVGDCLAHCNLSLERPAALIPAPLRVPNSPRPPLAILAGRRLAFGGACARADQQQRNCNKRTGLGHARITCCLVSTPRAIQPHQLEEAHRVADHSRILSARKSNPAGIL